LLACDAEQLPDCSALESNGCGKYFSFTTTCHAWNVSLIFVRLRGKHRELVPLLQQRVRDELAAVTTSARQKHAHVWQVRLAAPTLQ